MQMIKQRKNIKKSNKCDMFGRFFHIAERPRCRKIINSYLKKGYVLEDILFWYSKQQIKSQRERNLEPLRYLKFSIKLQAKKMMYEEK